MDEHTVIGQGRCHHGNDQITCEDCKANFLRGAEQLKALAKKPPVVEPLVMCGDRRRIADSITQVVAEGMHYFDRVDTVNLQTCSYTDIMELTKGWEDRYRNDPKFHAKVQSMVAGLLRILFT